MASTQTSTFIPPANPSTPGTSQWIYNEIMRNIEPDLMTTNLPTHTKKYKDETQEQRLARMKLYDEAFAVFDAVAAEYEDEFHRDMERTKENAKMTAMREDAKKLKTIEQEITNDK